MKKYHLIICIALISTFVVAAQEKGKENKTFDLEKFKTAKMAYLVHEADLTPEEANLLSPIYFEMQEKRFRLMMKMRVKSKELRSSTNPSGEECLKAVDDILENQIENANIEKAYYQKFKKILPPQKLLKLKHADYHFAQEMLKQNDKRR